MGLDESLIFKLGAVDRLAAGAVSFGEVSALLECQMKSIYQGFQLTHLDHELLNDTVEGGALVVQRLSRLSKALLTSAEAAEVLGSLGDNVRVELHGDAAGFLRADRDVKED